MTEVRAQKTTKDSLQLIVQELLVKIRTNLQVSLQVLEQIQQEQSQQIKASLINSPNLWELTQKCFFSPHQTLGILAKGAKQSNQSIKNFMEAQQSHLLLMQLSWRLPMFCMLSPEEFVKEIHKLPYLDDSKIIEILQTVQQKLENELGNSTNKQE